MKKRQIVAILKALALLHGRVLVKCQPEDAYECEDGIYKGPGSGPDYNEPCPLCQGAGFWLDVFQEGGD